MLSYSGSSRLRDHGEREDGASSWKQYCCLSFWGSSHPAVRQLVLPAVNALHAFLLALHSWGDEVGDVAEVL